MHAFNGASRPKLAEHDLEKLRIDRGTASGAVTPRRRRNWLRYAAVVLIALVLIGAAFKLAGPQTVETAISSATRIVSA